jgi:hypothetical protein
MTRSIRWLLVLLGLAGLPVATRAQERLRLDYDIEFAGLTIATMNIDLGFGERAYDVNTSIATTGLFGALYPISVQARTEGRMTGGQPLAEHHRSETRARGSTRVIEASFRDGKLVAFQRTANPPDPRADAESQVPEAERRESSDPATAILAVVQGVMSGRGCTQQVLTFDGRRLLMIRFADGANAPPPRSLSRSFGRATVACSFVYQSTDGATMSPPREGRAWLARVRPDAMAPLRVELETRWGTAAVQLRATPRGREAGVAPPG